MASQSLQQQLPGFEKVLLSSRHRWGHRLTASLWGFQTPVGIDFLASFILLALALVLYARLMPTVSNVQYERSPEPPQSADFPLFMDSNGSPMTVKFRLTISPLHPKIYHVVADDCIDRFLVDGRPIPQAVFGECMPNDGKELMLNEYLPPGEHTVEVSVSDNEGGSQGFDLNASYEDPLVLMLQAVIFVLISLSFFLFWRMLKLRKWWLFAILFAGLVLRLTYFYATPYNARANDVDAHVEYVQWILDHHSIPRVEDGWEFFQPPLYYAVSAVFGGIGKAVVHTRAALLWMLQFEGLLMSVVMLFLSVWIGSLLFPAEKQAEPRRAGRRWYVLFISLVATSPILIASAAKINNDVLIQLLSFLAVGFLVRFWQTGHRFHWYALTVVIILGILTKLNMVFFVPVAYLCLLFTRRLTFEQKLVLGGVTLLALLSFTEWFYILKYVGERASFPVGNIQGLNGDLTVGNTLSNFVAFHPLRFLRIPFVSPFDDISGRQFFWEYFLKTSVFGEYWFGEKPVVVLLARILNGMTLFILVPLGVYGILRAIVVRKERCSAFPLLCTFFLIIVGHLLFRYKAPFSPSQDFRYSIAALVPFFYFVLSGVRSLPRILRFVSSLALWAFVVFGAVFIVFILVFHL